MSRTAEVLLVILVAACTVGRLVYQSRATRTDRLRAGKK
jgi:hypothetical protein